jgi:quercetin dioxygenase-like cupin family protein
MALAEARRKFTIQVLGEQDVLWGLEGQTQQVLVGLLASTEHLTVAKIQLLPGQKSDLQLHQGDESLYLLEGHLNVRVPENDGQRWFELKPGDGFYIPQNVPHQYYNMAGQPVKFIFGVAPNF